MFLFFLGVVYLVCRRNCPGKLSPKVFLYLLVADRIAGLLFPIFVFSLILIIWDNWDLSWLLPPIFKILAFVCLFVSFFISLSYFNSLINTMIFQATCVQPDFRKYLYRSSYFIPLIKAGSMVQTSAAWWLNGIPCASTCTVFGSMQNMQGRKLLFKHEYIEDKVWSLLLSLSWFKGFLWNISLTDSHQKF